MPKSGVGNLTHRGASLENETRTRAPVARAGQVKLRLWELARFERVLYLDADTLVLRNLDEVFSALDDGDDRALGAVNDYFAGAVLLVAPKATAAAHFDATLRRDGGRYVYGEQDFLNAHFQGGHTRLGAEYHCFFYQGPPESRPKLPFWSRGATFLCPPSTSLKHLPLLNTQRAAAGLAEATAHAADSANPSTPPQTLEDLCAVLEFSSCAVDGAAVAWKPWHGAHALRDDRRVCIHHPGPSFRALLKRWEQTHARALETLARSGIEPSRHRGSGEL